MLLQLLVVPLVAVYQVVVPQFLRQVALVADLSVLREGGRILAPLCCCWCCFVHAEKDDDSKNS